MKPPSRDKSQEKRPFKLPVLPDMPNEMPDWQQDISRPAARVRSRRSHGKAIWQINGLQFLLLGAAIVVLGLGAGIGIKLATSKVVTSTTQPPLAPGLSDPNQTTATPSASEADRITLAEFNQIQKGMTIRQVEEIIGAPGKLIAQSKIGSVNGEVYSWKNPHGSNAIIEFKNDRVVAKAQAGL